MARKSLISVILLMLVFLISACGGKRVISKYEYNLSIEELKKRTSDKYLIIKKFLDENSKEYMELADGDKEAVKHLVKAAKILENIEYQIDNVHNLEILEWLNEEEKKGDEKAKLTKELFIAQQGVNAIDRMSNEIQLIKNIDKKMGIGVYPEDLTVEEFHKILFRMIDENKIDEVKKIVNQRSIVVRDGKELKAIDYVDYFKEDFDNMANELIEASKVSTDKNFNEFLELQAEALRKADPMLDAVADKKWATLQYTPLEFTITRENYDDTMTSSIIENRELYDLLKEKEIKIIPKDNLGCRVGIVNKKGTSFLMEIKKHMRLLANRMPYKENYDQMVLSSSDMKQTMVDVDMIISTGDAAAYRGGITVAENLPNDDKLSLTIGGGRRNVYHRQIRFIANPNEYKEKIEAILDREQHQYYNPEANHWFTIGHENHHSLGPVIKENGLGKYGSIIEENKADMGSLASLNFLTNLGMYTNEQKMQIVVTALTDFFVKTKPDISEAHRVRQVMQIKYLYDHGAFTMTPDGKIHINIEEAIRAADSMLAEIVGIQLSQNFEKAEGYINKNFVWTDYMETIGQKLQQVDKELNGKIEAKLAEKLLEN